MALADIIQAIKTEADQTIAQLVKEYAAKFRQLKLKYEQKAKVSATAITAEAAQKEASLKQKARVFAAIERRNAILKGKQDLIGQLCQEFLAGVVDTKEYPAMLLTLLQKAGQTISQGDLIPGKGQQAVMKQALAKAGLNYRLAAESQQFIGGFKLVSKEGDLDFSFEGLIGKKLREATETKIAKALFV